MGKCLIIKGADFSANAIGSSVVDITSLFTFTDGSVMQLYSGGVVTGSRTYSVTSSINAAVSNAVDVTQYRGKTLRFNGLAWQTSSGRQTVWGLQFFTGTPSSNNFIETPFISFIDSEIKGSGFAKEYSIVIPNNATYVITDFLNSSSQESMGISFYAYIE